ALVALVEVEVGLVLLQPFLDRRGQTEPGRVVAAPPAGRIVVRRDLRVRRHAVTVVASRGKGGTPCPSSWLHPRGGAQMPRLGRGRPSRHGSPARDSTLSFARPTSRGSVITLRTSASPRLLRR